MALKCIEELPDYVRVGHLTITINKMPHAVAIDTERWGEFSSGLGQISICEELPSSEYAVEIFLHELMHAIFYTTSLKELDDVTEEIAVTMIAKGLTQVFADNPWLSGWLGRWGKPWVPQATTQKSGGPKPA